ncbi:MAG: hypothetical protein CM15mP22_0090 [Gammaproteobacteria bacterium]|nr:MAG: hypothetical protein CM15mP22_0090 [Gammaproteobacteria bacterium]
MYLKTPAFKQKLKKWYWYFSYLLDYHDILIPFFKGNLAGTLDPGKKFCCMD